MAKEYLYLAIYSASFAIILGVTVDQQQMSSNKQTLTDGVNSLDTSTNFPYTATAFLVGSGTSILAGYVGMRIAVFTNSRTTFQCCRSGNSGDAQMEKIYCHDGFLAAFRGGQVLGFMLVGLALLILELLILVFKNGWYNNTLNSVVTFFMANQ